MVEESTTDDITQAEIKFMKGCVGCFLSLWIGPFILSGLFFLLLVVSSQTEVEWQMGTYYLQYEIDVGGNTGHHLLCMIDGKKVEILPHVYGYESENDYTYFVSAQGYAIVNQKNGSMDVVLLSENISKIKTPSIRYYRNFDVFSGNQQKKLLSLPHKMLAYRVSSGKDGGYFPIGDGRFQYSKFHYSDGWLFSLWGYGLKENYDVRSELLPHLNGYSMKFGQEFYATSPYGYAIVDGLRGTCRVYFTNQELAGKEYQKDIYVLDSFEDFTPEEQEILRQVEKDGLP